MRRPTIDQLKAALAESQKQNIKLTEENIAYFHQHTKLQQACNDERTQRQFVERLLKDLLVVALQQDPKSFTNLIASTNTAISVITRINVLATKLAEEQAKQKGPHGLVKATS